MTMDLRTIPGTDLKVSTLCYGVMRFNMRTRGEADFELYRHFREAGGNFFDTAHLYACWKPQGLGASEESLGACIRRFGDRSKVVVLTKGGCIACGDFYPRPDDCLTPEVIVSDLSESLERLQIDTVDIYMLHRDDTRHPVGEIIETLNAEIARGRVRYLGASNWTTARIAEANAYAESKQLQGFVISSPQWNLGHPNHLPVAPDGTLDSTALQTTEDDVRWYREHGFPLMPWTPTAYGFFAGNSHSAFDNQISQERLERARQLAEELGCTANQIALAYLINQDFPVFPVVGTTDSSHLAEYLAATSIRLSYDQCCWLRDG